MSDSRRSIVFSVLILLGLLPIWASTALAAPVGGGGWVMATVDTPFLFYRFDAEFSTTTNKIYILGGRLNDGNTDGSVWEYDPVTGAYTDTGVDMPVPTSNYQIARLIDSSANEVFMIFAGRNSAGQSTNTVQGYYPGSNTVVDLTATDPYPISIAAPGSVEVVNNIAYSFGGFDALGCNCVHAETFIFDINAAAGSRWTAGPNMNLARAYIASGVIDGVIYAAGGDTWDGVSTLTASTVVEKLDTANPAAWDDAGVADMPVACDEFKGFGFDTTSSYDFAGKFVTAGCGQWPSFVSESMQYDSAANTWDQTFPDLNIARRNHAGAFIPLTSGFEGVPGMWVWGGCNGSTTCDSTLVATPEFHPVTIVTPPCLYSNDFNDATMEWIEEKPDVDQPGDGFLHLTPVKKKAIAVADSSFAGASTGTYTFDVQFSGGTDPKNWVYITRTDKKNQLEILMKVATGKLVVKDRNGSVLAKAKADFAWTMGTPYQIIVNYDGTNIDVTINGTPVITDFVPSRALPSANIGAAAKDNTLLLDNVCVN